MNSSAMPGTFDSGLTRRRWLGALAASVASMPLHGQSNAGARPNILFILADDLGYGDLGCYGGTEIRTPNVDRLSSQGVRFTNFYVTWPACTPSRSGILTGRYPQRNGLYEMIRNNEVNWKYEFNEQTYSLSPEMTLGLDLREITIGDAMKKAGYATGIAGKWDSGRARRYLPQQRGFDFFYGFANTGIDYYNHERYGVPSMYRGNDRVKEEGHATDLFTREAMGFIERNRNRPFFLYLPFNAPHMASTFSNAQREAPQEYIDMYGGKPDWPSQYKALATHMDACIGKILQQLEQLGLAENTIVVFASDNGGGGVASNGPLRGRKATVYEGGIRVPLIVKWPGRVKPGTVNHEFVSALELFPTFLSAAGSAPPEGVKLDGFDMVPMLTEGAKTQRREMFWYRTWSDSAAARVDNWKWVNNAGKEELFDLAQDVGEAKNLTTERPEVAKRVRERYAAWKREMDAAEPRGPFRDY